MANQESYKWPQDKSENFDIERISAQMRKWKERLLDLTKANPLLGINRSRVSKLRVIEPDAYMLFNKFLVDEEELRMPLVRKKLELKISSLITEQDDSEEDYFIEDGDLAFEAKPIDLQRRLRRIFDNARTTVEERGVTTLHLTYGILEWDDQALGKSISPLWMVPCQFEYYGPKAALRLKLADDEIRINPALELYLRERQHVFLPALSEDLSSEDLKEYFSIVQELVKEQLWKVHPEIWLSTFSFESLAIYQDLNLLADIANKNRIVASFARAGTPSLGSETLGENLDDLPTPDQVPIPVMPTDSSQLSALTLAAAGENMVVHGPPGTGKSQTISNIIADALGKGKRVLFVSAKMAALEVVYRRLAEKGLARFCLEAHSTKAGKLKIIEELKHTLESKCETTGELFDEQLEELKKLRNYLNEYVRQLHERREPLGLSVFAAIGRISKLADAPIVTPCFLPWENPLTTSRSDLRAKLDLLDELVPQSAIYDNQDSHPWRGLDVHLDHQLRKDTLETALINSREMAHQLIDFLQTLSMIMGSNITDLSINELNEMIPTLMSLATCEGLPQRWFSLSANELAAVAELFKKAASQTKEFTANKIEYDRYFTAPIAYCGQLLMQIDGEYRSWTRIFKPQYWRWRASIRKIATPKTSIRISALKSYSSLTTLLANCEEWLSSNEASLHQFLSFAERDYREFEKAAGQYTTATLIMTEIVKNSLLGSNMTTLSADIRAAAGSTASILGDADSRRALQFIDNLWPHGFVCNTTVTDAPIHSVLKRFEELLGSFSRLHEWILLQHTIQRCKAAGLGAFLAALGKTSVCFAPAGFERRFLTLWVDRITELTPALGLFSPQRRAERIERFRELDGQIRKSALGRIKKVAAEPVSKISNAQTIVGGLGEVGILQRELQKTKRIKPLRRLFSEIPHVLQAIKPCMLMSPLSVSTFLKPGSIEFDLVVFDEASQIPTQEAIPSILRGNQIIVAGDENQLPPTSFFDASIIYDEAGEEEDDEELIPLESLLNDCVAIKPIFLPAYLKWHYRSRDERLISFSNHNFYNNALVTFPSVTTNSEGQGIHYIYVSNGVWDRGRSRTNRREALKVAEAIIEQLSQYPDRSLGVVAMNTTQREAIEVILNELIEQHPEIVPLLGPNRIEPFFIKSLENVQGDERDTIIISVGYAKTESGALGLNFGPLNREGGWRRLNVLVTRAKWQTILVTSLKSQELVGVNPNNRGALMLKKFIEYSEAGGVLPPELIKLSHAETNDFEEAVAEALRQHDLEIDEQVGVSSYRIDLAIRDPRDKRRYLLGVECDGASYHSARIARERDLLRQKVLRNLGWCLHRVWSTAWFRDRDDAIRGVLRSIEIALRSNPDESPEAPIPPNSDTSPDNDPPSSSESKTEAPGPRPTKRRFLAGQPYQKYRRVVKIDRREIMDPLMVNALEFQIAKIMMQEAPIHEDVLFERLKELYGISRIGARIEANVEKAIARVIRRPNFRHDEERHILYGGLARITRFRVPGDGVKRSFEQIAVEEIEHAILFIIEDQFGFPREHLPRAITDLFQIGRTSAGIAMEIGDIVDNLIEQGQLRLVGPNIYLG